MATAETRPVTRGEAWIHEETVLLIELWADERVQDQLENTPRRNIEVFRRIAEDIKDRLPDFERSAQECRARIKRLKTMCFQTKRANNKSGGKRKTFPYYERLDAILNTRPSVNPIALPDTLGDENNEDSENETGEDTQGEDADSSIEDSENNASRSDTPVSGPSRPETPSNPEKDTPRPKSSKTKEKFDSRDMMKQFLEMEDRTEKKFWEFEEKRLKIEQDQEEKRRNEENEREERQRREDRNFMSNMMAMQMNIMRMQNPHYGYQNAANYQPFTVLQGSNSGVYNSSTQGYNHSYPNSEGNNFCTQPQQNTNEYQTSDLLGDVRRNINDGQGN